MFCGSFMDGKMPIEIMEWNVPHLTKRIYDIVLLSMRAEYPDRVLSSIYVDGVHAGAIDLRYIKRESGKKRVISTYRLFDGIKIGRTCRISDMSVLGDRP